MMNIRYRGKNGQFVSRTKAKRRKPENVTTELRTPQGKLLKRVQGYRDRVILRKPCPPRKVYPPPEPVRIRRRGMESAELEEFEEEFEEEYRESEEESEEWDDMKGDFPSLKELDDLDDLDELLADEDN